MTKQTSTPRKHLSEEVKWRIVTDRLRGRTIQECAAFYKVAPSTVVAAYKQFKAGKSLKRKKGSGRPRKTTQREDRLLHMAARRNREATVAELCEQVGVQVSRWTVQRRVAEIDGMTWRPKTKKPMLSEKNKKARLKWAREHQHWTPKDWSKVLWSDESPFTLHFNIKKYHWGRDHEKLKPFAIQPTVKHSKRINVWGCFAAGGVGVLHRIEGIMTK